MGSGKRDHPLPTHNMDQCVLVPSVNQSLAKKGLSINRIVLNRQECNGPAAGLNFQPQHCVCKHLNIPFQRSAGTRLGYAVIQPVVAPPSPNRLADLHQHHHPTRSDDLHPVHNHGGPASTPLCS